MYVIIYIYYNISFYINVYRYIQIYNKHRYLFIHHRLFICSSGDGHLGFCYILKYGNNSVDPLTVQV